MLLGSTGTWRPSPESPQLGRQQEGHLVEGHGTVGRIQLFLEQRRQQVQQIHLLHGVGWGRKFNYKKLHTLLHSGKTELPDIEKGLFFLCLYGKKT